MTRITYMAVGVTATRTGRCPVCGKRAQRSRRFEQTVNPWNRNAEGGIKTATEIYEEVRAAADAWQPDDLIHGKCRDA